MGKTSVGAVSPKGSLGLPHPHSLQLGKKKGIWGVLKWVPIGERICAGAVCLMGESCTPTESNRRQRGGRNSLRYPHLPNATLQGFCLHQKGRKALTSPAEEVESKSCGLWLERPVSLHSTQIPEEGPLKGGKERKGEEAGKNIKEHWRNAFLGVCFERPAGGLPTSPWGGREGWVCNHLRIHPPGPQGPQSPKC